MKIKSLWIRDYQSVVDNGRNHSIVVDLPSSYGGSNNGPTALEVCAMSLGGCIGTIFAMIAKKMKIEFDKLEVEMETEQKNNAQTITDVSINLMIKSNSNHENIEKCLEHTLNTCPVGLIFKQAGINIVHKITML